MDRIALIVGNGLTLSLGRLCAGGTLGAWSTSDPLKWNIHDPDDENRKLVQRADHRLLAEALEEERKADPVASDFLLIAKVAQRGDAWLSNCLRHFLAEAFSYHHRLIQIPARSAHFEWTQWLTYHAARLAMCVSFNYDLVLEMALETAGISYARVGIQDERGLPILKPHGSIDFVTSAVPNAPGVVVTNSDAPQRRMTEDELTGYRSEALLVPPGTPSDLRRHQAVRPGIDLFRRLAPSLSHVVIVGLSYWDVDRPEVDELLSSLPPATRVVVANPFPPQDLRNTLTRLGLEYEEWLEGPFNTDPPHRMHVLPIVG